MKINVIFLKTDIGFNREYEKRVERLIREVANQAAKILDLKGKVINFTVYPYKFAEGWTRAKDWITLTIPKNYPENELRGLVCHEMHHIKTDYCVYSERKTFLDSLFFEGLAVAFQIEQSKKIPKYVKYDSKLIKKWLPVLRKQNFSSKKYNYYEWFWGTGKLPKSLGYKLARYLIDQVQKNYPNLIIIDLTKKRPKELLKLSGVNLK